MSHTPENPSAFPSKGRGPSHHDRTPGMTLRDYFAGQVIGHIMHAGLIDGGKMPAPSKFAAAAYATADAMLAERARGSAA